MLLRIRLRKMKAAASLGDGRFLWRVRYCF